MNLFRKNDRLILPDVISLIVIIVYIVIAASFFGSPEMTDHFDEITDLTGGWRTSSSDGVEYSLDSLPKGDISLTHDLTGTDLSRKRLCFKSVNTHFTAIFDGVEVYHYAPELAPIFGKSYGSYIHMIPIPADAKSVTLKIHPVYKEDTASLKYVAVEDAGIFMSDIYHRGLPNFALCALIVLYGILMLIIGFTGKQTKDGNDDIFFPLGTFAILVGVWSSTDTYIIQAYTHRPEVMRLIDHMCLIFISYHPVSLMAKAKKDTKTILLPIMFSLTVINFVLTVIISLLGIGDIRTMLPFSHINIGIAFIMTVYLMVSAVKMKTIDKDFLQSIISGVTVTAIGVGMDMLRFQLFPNDSLDTSTFTRIGVMALVILMGIHLMRERTRLAVERGRAELIKKMAFSDSLTGLANRAAFHEKETEIRCGHSDCTIVQLDINYLKRVNDDYGHAEGDLHIIRAAHIIRDIFDGVGVCFRTGGDEFVVIAKKLGIEEVEGLLKQMENSVHACNEAEKPPVPLQIAYGYAFYIAQDDMLEAAELLADKRMYERKREMKEQNLN